MVGRLPWGLLVLGACANAGDAKVMPDAAGMHDSGGGGGDDSGGVVPHTCNSGELATALDVDGTLTCAPLTTETRDAVGANCAAYLGWRDSCDGCTLAPAKYGDAGAACSAGVGAGNTCTTPLLGASTVALFGLNLDGNVDGNDKLYGGLHCSVPGANPAPGPCPAGTRVTGVAGGNPVCTPIAAAAVDYVRTSCSLYLGWQDGCAGCINPPTKWGHAGDSGCENGLGVDDTCTTATIGADPVNLFGLSFDGDVDDNDKIHVGLQCTAPTPVMSSAQSTCPAGQFVTGTTSDGSLVCSSAAPLFHAYVTEHCSLYFGWRDGCDGCLLAPAKWGQAKVGACTLGAGANDTCTTFALGGTTVAMFGLATDGDVDENDMLYAALHCE